MEMTYKSSVFVFQCEVMGDDDLHNVTFTVVNSMVDLENPLASSNDASTSSVCQEAPANDEPQEVDETMLQQQV